jgi:hypothetical protein
MFGVDWFREGVPVDKEASVLTNETEVVAGARRKTMADALVIEARAQCWLADEVDAAQGRGEMQTQGGQNKNAKFLKRTSLLMLGSPASRSTTRARYAMPRRPVPARSH